MWEVSFVVRPKFKHFPPNFTNFCLPSKSSCLATLVKTLHSEMLNSSKIYFKSGHSGDYFDQFTVLANKPRAGISYEIYLYIYI